MTTTITIIEEAPEQRCEGTWQTYCCPELPSMSDTLRLFHPTDGGAHSWRIMDADFYGEANDRHVIYFPADSDAADLTLHAARAAAKHIFRSRVRVWREGRGQS